MFQNLSLGFYPLSQPQISTLFEKLEKMLEKSPGGNPNRRITHRHRWKAEEPWYAQKSFSTSFEKNYV